MFYHPGVSHPESFCTAISIRVSHTQNPSPPPFPPGCLTTGNSVRPTFHLLRMSHIRNPAPPSFPSPGVSHFKFSSLGFQVLKITFLIKLCCHFHSWQAIFILLPFLKRFEISKGSSFIIPNNGVIGIDSGKIKWALVGALHM